MVSLINLLLITGDLFDFLKGKEKLQEEEARLVVQQLLEATAFVHSQGIVHRDIKLENILVDLDQGAIRRIVLTDFGMAKSIAGRYISTELKK